VLTDLLASLVEVRLHLSRKNKNLFF
jgi:hypothetical protein